ncbi:hypothetical protein B7P43_G02377 [Cryptotermes secundus]|uniref:Alsin n=1 Tax=Cryptotermes secundus TaxID=105785 RepID=A0A2J7RB16_9NEOP|nr:hypothetical protein B7P43_G02377 [Cryptotermes secundus]
MTEIHLWYGLDKLAINFEPSDLPKDIIKVCKINRHIFALTNSKSIYHSEMEPNGENKVIFTNTNISAIDIACNNKILYFVSDSGQVFKTDPEDLAIKEEIILKEDAKCCSHGYKTSGHRVKVKTVVAEECSCLYVTESGQLWMSGNQPKLGKHDEVPQRVTFFEKRYVISVACGANFSIALVYKPGHSVPDKGNSDTDDDNEDVFVSDCPICISSPTSQQSASDTCPLGLHVQQTSDEHCSTSSTSKGYTAEDKRSTDDSTSASTDEKTDGKDECSVAEKKLHLHSDGDDLPADESSQSIVEGSQNISRTVKTVQSDANEGNSECMKEEKKNEFFISTEAARQFLTRQLSWVSGYGSAGEDLVECAEASLALPSRIIKQNMSSVASLVYEGVKTVGDRGAILFRHMSGGSETSGSVPGGLAGCGSFEDLSAEDFIVAAPSITSSLRCEESFWSSSCGTSDRGEESEIGIAERVAAMAREGSRLLSTELWSWGDITHGQLGTDVFVHVSGGNQNVHPLTTVWVDAIQDTDTVQNAIQLTMPEETLVVHTPTPHAKMEWFQSLQGAIKKSLQKNHSHVPPAVRTAKYVFTKHHLYKDAKYTGRWYSGKLQGPGKLEWPDGKVYVGQFQNSQMNGIGRMENPGISTYEGQWKDGQQDGYGIMKYTNGDVYEGHFKDGVAHGHGLQKQGHFMASVASVYIGEWVNGVKQGYGVMDDIVTGEKYLGYWSNNMKHGCGLIVTLDGIYYEGVFTQDVLTGHGIMVFEDGTHYEGEFRAAGVFSGKGTLIFNSGDRIEGALHGAWNEGVKITGTLHKNTATPPNQLNTKPSSFGKLCVAANQKWMAIFRQCYQQLGMPEPMGTKGAKTNVELQKVWEKVAVVINNSQQERGIPSSDQLDTIPQFGRDRLDKESYQELRLYLTKAFESQHHPLGRLLAEVTAAYTATYGGVRVHPLLLSHAVAELHSITARMYEVVRALFPALPVLGQELRLVESQEAELESEVVSAAALLHPFLLPRVHSALFVLYALHNKEEDDAYWKRLLKWNKQPDITLMAFLGIDQEYYVWNLNDTKAG